MHSRTRTFLAAGAASLVAHAALATTVKVVVTGVVENNAFTSGTFAGVPAGAPVTLTIFLDSNNYLDSPNLPGITRGYRFNASTCSLSVGSVTTTLRTSPVPPAYFVVRNNDPRADGFFISQGTDIDTHIPLQMTPSGYGIAFHRTFGSIPPTPPGGPDPTLTSVDILGATGSWGLENLSVYNFTIQLGEFSTPMIFEYRTLAITACPEIIEPPADATLCPDAGGVFSVLAGGTGPLTYRWQWSHPTLAPAWIDMVDGVNLGAGAVPAFSTFGVASDQLTGFLAAVDDVRVRCVVTNACGSATSAPASARLKSQDVNQDGNADQGDIDALIDIVGGGANPTNYDPDLNADGNVDQGDIDALIDWVAGGACP